VFRTRRSLISREEGACGGKGLFRFPRRARLKGRDDIRDVFRQGRVYGCAGAKLFLLENESSEMRICVALPRKYGNAVQRNRARRIGRESFRLLRPRLRAGGYDAVFLMYRGGIDSLAAGMERLAVLFSRAGLLMDGR
jgi:ribonuclease P protein component